MSTNDGEVAVGWALEGRGLLLRSQWDIAHDVERGRLRIVLPEWSMPADIHAVYPTRRGLPARTRAFIDHLAQQFEGAGGARGAGDAGAPQRGPVARSGATGRRGSG